MEEIHLTTKTSPFSSSFVSSIDPSGLLLVNFPFIKCVSGETISFGRQNSFNNSKISDCNGVPESMEPPEGGIPFTGGPPAPPPAEYCGGRPFGSPFTEEL